MNNLNDLTCPHCGARVENTSLTDQNHCPRCHHVLSASIPDSEGASEKAIRNANAQGGRELPELRAPYRNFQAVRSISLVVLAISILFGGFIFFQTDVLNQESALRHVGLILMATLAVGAGFVLAYMQFAMTLKSRR